MQSSKVNISQEYQKRIFRLHEDLGIPSDYGLSHKLDLQPEAEQLAHVALDLVGRDHFLTPAAKQAWLAMQSAARRVGQDLILISGFRSVERQAYLIKGKLKAGEPLDLILSRLAAPGYSEHHTGGAIDLAVPEDPVLEERFEKTLAFNWLIKNAGQFGFRLSYPRDNQHNIIYEPWHWLFIADEPNAVEF